MTAPISATLLTVIPFAYAVVLGGRPGWIGAVGAVIALAGLALVSADRSGEAEVHRGGVHWAVLSGFAYGFGNAALLHVSEESGAWPVVSQRGTSFVMLAVLAVAMGLPALPPVRLRTAAVVGGVFAAGASVFYLEGVYTDAPPAIVATSMYPIAAVVAGRVFYQDRIVPLQVLGMGVSLIGIVAVVMG